VGNNMWLFVVVMSKNPVPENCVESKWLKYEVLT
jgi:hypothetical protein